MKAWKREAIAVVYCVIMVLPPAAWGEGFFLKRDRSDIEEFAHEQDYKVKTMQEAEVQLEKYGYIKGCHVTRVRRNIIPGGLFNVVEFEDKKKKDDCSEERIRASLLEYQKNYGLPQTGRFDAATQKLMNSKRCGNKDEGELPVKNSTGSTVKPNKTDTAPTRASRTARSADSNVMPKEAPSEYSGSLLSKLFPKASQNPLSRRKRQYEEILDVLRTGKESDFVIRNPKDAERVRRKRSVILNTDKQGTIFNKNIVTWRLLSSGYSTKIPVLNQEAIVQLAFRMWSEVIPLQFIRDSAGHVGNVDIEIAFGKGTHLNCGHDFDGRGGEVAHSWVTGDIHFDDDEVYIIDDNEDRSGVQLLKVAVHEIGHVLGLLHTSRSYSIMFPFYQTKDGSGNNFELGWEDRKEVQKIYGTCRGKFNTIFDWLRMLPNDQMVYNSYFFRDGKYWMYENSANRTRYGDPQFVISNWKGVPDKLDGYAHVYISNYFGSQVTSEQYFFSGDSVYLYNPAQDSVMPGWPKKMKDVFKAKPGQTERIPDNIDTVYFDFRDQNFYFFKGQWVYVFKPGSTGCCERKSKIKDEFPGLTSSDELPSDLDAVYFSFKDTTVYFVKDEDIWKNQLYSFGGNIRNGIKKLGNWWEKWYDICEVD